MLPSTAEYRSGDSVNSTPHSAWSQSPFMLTVISEARIPQVRPDKNPIQIGFPILFILPD